MNYRDPADFEPRDQEKLYIIPFINWAMHTTLRDEAEHWTELGYDVIETTPYEAYKSLSEDGQLNCL